MKVKSEREVAQSCPTLSDPMDYSPSGSSIHGIFKARVLEWVAIAFSITGTYIYICLYFQQFYYNVPAVAGAKSLQSCPTLCDPIDSSPLGSSVPGILQARTLECVAISFSNE